MPAASLKGPSPSRTALLHSLAARCTPPLNPPSSFLGMHTNWPSTQPLPAGAHPHAHTPSPYPNAPSPLTLFGHAHKLALHPGPLVCKRLPSLVSDLVPKLQLLPFGLVLGISLQQ